MRRYVILHFAPAIALGTVVGLAMAQSNREMIHTIAADYHCPADRISIITRFGTLGSGGYLMSVCGTEMRYERSGAAYSLLPLDPCPDAAALHEAGSAGAGGAGSIPPAGSVAPPPIGR